LDFLNNDLPERTVGFIAKEHRAGYAAEAEETLLGAGPFNPHSQVDW